MIVKNVLLWVKTVYISDCFEIFDIVKFSKATKFKK